MHEVPITSKGNRYLITAICMSSKFPEAIPVSDISSVSVTDALLNIFSRMGFPVKYNVIQDAGSEWDKHLASILLALRTVSHESTGYTPSELVYGKNLRTPETLVMEHWMEPEEGIIEVGESDYMSPMILVEVAGKEPRPCIDYRKLNGIIRTEYFPLPNIEERIETVSAAKFITVLIVSKGYWQIQLSKTAQRDAAFCTSFGT
ncbi:retrovirus-related Pol polyprotein from transposon 297 [Trichonephila clavipes]|nr:retrovirus-related Pol polyprotein from transposon 297 [Trichonephila clavipes]